MHKEIKDSISTISQELNNLKKYLISSNSDTDDSLPLSHEKHLDAVNSYLTLGNGRGRLQSKATVYNGKIGYFFVGMIKSEGERAESIIFSTVDGGPDTILTQFPFFTKNL